MKTKARRTRWFGAVVVLLTFVTLLEARLWRPGTVFVDRNNVQIGEAQAWLAGRTDLPERLWDTALKDGRVVSHFPPMFSFIATGLVPIFHGVPHWFVVLFVALPVPLLAYVLFLGRGDSPRWAALGAIGFMFGTSAYPVIDSLLRGCSPYLVNQALATIGLLILLIEYFGRRRVWLAGFGVIVATLSRQLSIFYLIPLAWMAWQDGEGPIRRGRCLTLTIIGLVVVAVPLVMNTIKFGHPLDSGYKYVYADRAQDNFSRDAAQYGIFSFHYVPRNLYYANLGFPRLHEIQMAGKPEFHLRPNRMGTGIWWTTPLLLWLFLDFPRIVRDPRSRYLLLATALVAGGLMFYHSTGFEQRGFNRYSLDYLPALMAMVAPSCFASRRRWISVGMIAWSVIYFRWLI
ncbi:MAG: hypothetical protein IID43_03600 [Planctomycetes bacterium]|nr:hypothetical protein [Planctomycetota bacterium]